MMRDADTIFAVASGGGRAAIALIRISGPAAAAVLRRLAGIAAPQPRRAVLADFKDPGNGEVIDRGLALWFPGPASYSGDDMLELHVHGGPAVVADLIEVLARETGVRPAEPGEFTRRAFEAGKLDLTAAEGVADLIAAETSAQRRQALRQSDGALAALYDGWAGRLRRLLAHLEAELDFPDEDLPADVGVATRPEIAALAAEIGAHLADDRRGERLRDGLYVAIIGAPNAGKSSLLNALAGREAAIVSETAGTTRDVVEVRLDLAGFPVTLADTAGLREMLQEMDGHGAIEREGIRRARLSAERADLRLAVFDMARPPDAPTRALAGADGIVVGNKADLTDGACPPAYAALGALAISARDGQGLDRLLAVLGARAKAALAVSAAPALTRARHRQALEECRESLRRADAGTAAELAAEDLRLALRAIGRITGRVDVEDLLDIIFRDFCIGK